MVALALPRPQQKGAPAEIIAFREEQKKGAAPAKGTNPYPVHPAHSGWPSAAVIAAQEAPFPLPAPIDNIKI